MVVVLILDRIGGGGNRTGRAGGRGGG